MWNPADSVLARSGLSFDRQLTVISLTANRAALAIEILRHGSPLISHTRSMCRAAVPASELDDPGRCSPPLHQLRI